jgi:hypothetical protein
VFEEVYLDFKIKEDLTIEPPIEDDLKRGSSFIDDYLYDLVNQKKDE